MFSLKLNKQLLVLECIACVSMLTARLLFFDVSPEEITRLIVYVVVFFVLSYTFLESYPLRSSDVVKIGLWFVISLILMYLTGYYQVILPLAVGIALMPAPLLLGLILLMLVGLPGNLLFVFNQVLLVLFFIVAIKRVYRLVDTVWFVAIFTTLFVILNIVTLPDLWTNTVIWKEALDVSVITLLLYMLAQFLVGSQGYTGSRLVLYELINPAHPLLKQLSYKAPGTYQHSVNVGILAVEAGKAIGNVDLLLLQAGALVHDIGKIESPEYFTENQSSTDDKYFEKNIEQSTNMIIKHVANGLRLVRKYKLPRSIEDIITGHHGTTLTSFYYRKKSKSEQADEEKFRYPGPKPQLRESCIIMLADSIEAAARSTLLDIPYEDFEEKARKLINQIIEQKMQDNQLSECHISTKELALMKDSFIYSLKFIYHKRLKDNYEKREE